MTGHTTKRRRVAVLLPAVVALAAALALSTAALAQVSDPYGGGTPLVSPSSLVAPTTTVVVQSPVRTAAQQPASTGTLPLTGADIAGLLVLAIALFGIGAVLVTVGRRRRAPINA